MLRSRDYLFSIFYNFIFYVIFYINNKKIKYHIAITGEISLDGNVTEIGGLDLIFIGGIKAGVKDFIFPNENLKDYTAFIDKYKGSELLEGINFYPVDTIDDVLKLVFENEE